MAASGPFETFVNASAAVASTERTDTRVLQVIYSFDHGTLPVYVGQRMNVFIQAPAVPVGKGELYRAESNRAASGPNRRQ